MSTQIDAVRNRPELAVNLIANQKAMIRELKRRVEELESKNCDLEDEIDCLNEAD